MIAAASPTFNSSIVDRMTMDAADGIRLVLVVDPDTLAADMATYDPGSATSPSVAVCRKYIRALFDSARVSMVSDYGLPDPCPNATVPPGETTP